MPDNKLMVLPQELLILGAAVKTGIIEALHQSTTYSALAADLNLNPRSVRVVVEALADLGHVSRHGDKITLSEETQKMLYDREAPNYIGFAFMHRYKLLRSWVHLPEVLKTGEPAPSDPDPENTRYFMEGMRHSAEKGAPVIAEFLLPESGHASRVLDIGGGPLIYAGAFTARGAKVTVQDLSTVVKLMQEKANQAGITLLAGDFTQELSPGPFDLAYLGNICHILDEVGNLELFKKVNQVLTTSGRIAIVDMLRGTHPFASVFAVNMLVNTAKGGTWTFEQYTEWLTTAGFHDVQVNEVAGRQIITAVKS